MSGFVDDLKREGFIVLVAVVFFLSEDGAMGIDQAAGLDQFCAIWKALGFPVIRNVLVYAESNGLAVLGPFRIVEKK